MSDFILDKLPEGFQNDFCQSFSGTNHFNSGIFQFFPEFSLEFFSGINSGNSRFLPENFQNFFWKKGGFCGQSSEFWGAEKEMSPRGRSQGEGDGKEKEEGFLRSLSSQNDQEKWRNIF